QKAAAPDINVTGTIQHLETSHAGVHLLVRSPQGVVDAHLGSHLTPEGTAQLSADQPAQIVGCIQTVNGHDWLLVRQLTISGSTITIRNQYGSPVHYRTAGGNR